MYVYVNITDVDTAVVCNPLSMLSIQFISQFRHVIMGVNALFFIFLRILSTLCILPNTYKVFIPYMLAVQMYIKLWTLFNLHFIQWVTLLNNIVPLLVFFIHDVIIYSRSLFSDFQNLITCKTLCRLCIMSLNNEAKFWRLEPLRIKFLHSCSCFFYSSTI